MPHQKGIKPVAQNRKAFHDYFVEERYECGIELFGTEVKSMRLGRVSLKESWAAIRRGEIFVEGMHISPYEQGNQFNRDPMRPKRLLMHKSEIRKLDGLVARQGYTLIPLEVYLKDGRMKLQLGLCRGKAEHDKRRRQARRRPRDPQGRPPAQPLSGRPQAPQIVGQSVRTMGMIRFRRECREQDKRAADPVPHNNGEKNELTTAITLSPPDRR